MSVEVISDNHGKRVTVTEFFTLSEKGNQPLSLQNGGKLAPVTVAYQTYGTPRPIETMRSCSSTPSPEARTRQGTTLR